MPAIDRSGGTRFFLFWGGLAHADITFLDGSAQGLEGAQAFLEHLAFLAKLREPRRIGVGLIDKEFERGAQILRAKLGDGDRELQETVAAERGDVGVDDLMVGRLDALLDLLEKMLLGEDALIVL